MIITVKLQINYINIIKKCNINKIKINLKISNVI